jgi:hypothetical protein
MTTLGAMKSRIADELARADLAGPIATAINDAIAAYQDDRLFYNDRTTLRPPPANDGETGNIWMTYAEKLIRTRAKLELALHWLRDTDLAKAMQDAEQIVLAELRNRVTFPVPGVPGTRQAMKSTIADELQRDDLTLQIANSISRAIVAYQTDRLFFNDRTTLKAEPASDGEADNFWMTEAERLIRARAKREIALHVLRDVELAQAMEIAEQAAIAELRLRATTAPGTPGTLGAMKSTIADEIRRDDLAAQIAQAIATAIAHYQRTRFYFTEARGPIVTFNTEAGRQDYGFSDNANIPDMLAFDYVAITVGSRVSMLQAWRPEVIEDLTNNQAAIGEPYAWCWYDRLIRLYPIPGQVYPVRFPGHVKRAGPASDSEAGNLWMTEAESLIRSRAKWELAVHVLNDPGLAAAMSAAMGEAEAELKGVTARKTGTGCIIPTQF